MASAVETAASKGKTLQYQGRKASRAKSEQRRRLILEAALRIVVTEGVRGIRHRAVAKEADVPLAATTYYFKDIDELIVDTFTLYTEKALSVVSEFTQQFHQPLSHLAGREVTSEAGLETLIDYMVAQVSAYMRNQVMEQRDMRIVEQAFRYEAIINPSIRKLAQLHRKALMDKATEFFTKVANSRAPEADAEILIGLFHTLEYNALLSAQDEPDMTAIGNTIRHYLSMLLPSLLNR